jgi:DNA-binding transcriptional regulator YiaG
MIDVARLRKSLGESQSAFAERFGVNQSTVSRWEDGEEPSGPALILLTQMENERAAKADSEAA